MNNESKPRIGRSFLDLPDPEEGRCGRPRKDGALCRNERGPRPACWHHVTQGEEASFQESERRRLQEEADFIREACRRDPVGNTVAACHTWPAPEKFAPSWNVLRDWHDGRCAICGGPNTDVDHCHRSGMVRGFLCRGCNSGEGDISWEAANAYRNRPPVAIIGWSTLYVGAFTGVAEPQEWVVNELGPPPEEGWQAALYLQAARALTPPPPDPEQRARLSRSIANAVAGGN